MALIRRLGNIVSGRSKVQLQDMNYQGFMNLLLSLEASGIKPSFNLAFRDYMKDTAVGLVDLDISKMRMFANEKIRPEPNFDVIGSREGHYGRNSAKYYIALRKVPSPSWIEKIGEIKYDAGMHSASDLTLARLDITYTLFNDKNQK